MDASGLPPRFDALDPAVLEDPYPTYARLRAAGPLCRFGPGSWGVTRHADVVALQRDPRLGSEFPEAYHHLSVGAGPASHFFQRIMLYRDPPDHVRLRRLMSGAFTPAVVRRMRGYIEQTVDDLLAPALESGSCDVVRELAYPLPVLVVSTLMGIPPEAHDDVRLHAMRLGRAFSAIVPADARGAAHESVEWLRGYIGGLLDERRKAPGDDLLSTLLQAEDDGDRLSHDEIVDNTVFSFFAGFETTVHLITNGFAALLRAPDQFALLRADPGLVPGAVEEFLRFEAPIQGTARLVREPVTIGSRTVRAGRVLVLMLGSANHDEAVFHDPGTLDVTRNPNPHVTFGGGGHLCLGAFLARTEAQVVFDWVLRRTRSVEQAGDLVRESDTPFRAFAHVPLAIKPA
ncbi:cytochrome P450 [Micromonospora fiedleri]|uniref:Cytochrome P450 n=1 Tax=Micromonospora fiedleri TaxID=1157498 RepID=A0ABS1UWZ8_9ACTN|nr:MULTISPECIES: cytochrome P450 [Micromonospora]MBL6279831.1 cytochrome P450 [Micromonospora fiedleri]WSK43679.1 cytochrome P450 [Micromonospora maris]